MKKIKKDKMTKTRINTGMWAKQIMMKTQIRVFKDFFISDYKKRHFPFDFTKDEDSFF